MEMGIKVWERNQAWLGCQEDGDEEEHRLYYTRNESLCEVGTVQRNKWGKKSRLRDHSVGAVVLVLESTIIELTILLYFFKPQQNILKKKNPKQPTFAVSTTNNK